MDSLQYRERDSAFIPAHTWPNTLIQLALERGQPEHKLLRNTGIFREDIGCHKYLTPEQVFQLMENVLSHLQGHELFFLLGRQWFPTQDNPFHTCNHLQQLLDVLNAQSDRYLPLIGMEIHYEPERVLIYWQDNFGAHKLLPLLVAMQAASLHSLSRWCADIHLPWTFYFSQARPMYIEQFQVHLGTNVIFSAPANAMAIDRVHLHQHWATQASTDNASNVSHAAQAPVPSFLQAVYVFLQSHLAQQPNLETCAAAFGMSSASFKRKLHKHHSSFQQQLDLVRKHLALRLLGHSDLTQEQVARQLHFYDAANLRRAFKRWTGQLPGKL